MPIRRAPWIVMAVAIAAGSAAAAGGPRPDGARPQRARPAPTQPERAAKHTGHWAWQPVGRPRPPEPRGSSWAKNPLDAFILDKLEEAGIEPAPAASPAELLRRGSLDLTGLPPEPDEVLAFEEDSAPDAWERAVDRLLASPRYGERWGRHWLDLARYADSNGFEHDELRSDAWRYRDYVVRAWNADKPYDRFIEEQLAGDELAPGNAEALVATGFNLLGPDMTDAADQTVRRHHTLNDMTDTTGLVFLGLTIGCARCHDHKFEPIPQADYYRLQAFFTPTVFRNDVVIASRAETAAHEEASRAYQSVMRPIADEIARIEEPHRRRLYEEKLARLSEEAQAAHRKPASQRNPGENELADSTARLVSLSDREVAQALTDADRKRREALETEMRKLDGRRPPPLPRAMALAGAAGPPARTFVLARGEPGNPLEEAFPGFPSTLEGGAQPAAALPSEGALGSEGALDAEAALPAEAGGRRARLARWIVSPRNPLTARVMVNRVWYHHFGRGLVATTSDFGLRGEPPTHPELLDWIADRFVSERFGLKALHRLIMTSAVYRQSSRASPAALEKDPENRLLSRFGRRRLEAEAIRDSLLFASGLLDERRGGPPVPASGARRSGGAGGDRSAEGRRRSIYLLVKRNLRQPFLEPFDAPDTNASCPERGCTVTAPQALALLNGEEALEAARALAGRLEREFPEPGERARRTFLKTLGRSPTPAELAVTLEFVRSSPWSELCRALFNLNEFAYVE